MVEELLKSAQSDVAVSRIFSNVRYRFEIKLASSEEWNYKLLFTDGMAVYEQQVKEGYEDFKKIELYFLLPDFWDIDKTKWPEQWLNRLGELPQKNNTWFGPGDTIPAGNPPQVLSDRFPANHFMLVEPLTVAPLFEHEVIQKSGIRFFGVVPISQFELEYKIRNSATVLLTRLQKKGYSEMVDLFRKPVCRKRILGLF